MRMWLVNPKILCRQHLLGEHVELHLLVGHLRKNRSIAGFISKNCVEPMLIAARHKELVTEMLYRGYSHNSELGVFPLAYLGKKAFATINKKKALTDLLCRCKKCKRRAMIEAITEQTKKWGE